MHRVTTSDTLYTPSSVRLKESRPFFEAGPPTPDLLHLPQSLNLVRHTRLCNKSRNE